MKRYALLLTLPSLALAMERTASGPDGALAVGNARLNLPVCHPAQALTVKNGGFACMNIQPNVVIVGSCTTTLVAPRSYRSEVLCPVSHTLIGCSGGAQGNIYQTGPQAVEPFTSSDRMGCRSTISIANGPTSNPVYATCLGEPGLTANASFTALTGCYSPPAPGDGSGPGDPGDASSGDGDSGDAAGGDGDGGDGGGDA